MTLEVEERPGLVTAGHSGLQGIVPLLKLSAYRTLATMTESAKAQKHKVFCKGVWKPLHRFNHGLFPLFNNVFIKLACFMTVQ